MEKKNPDKSQSSSSGGWFLVVLGVIVVIALVVALFNPTSGDSGASTPDSVAQPNLRALEHTDKDVADPLKKEDFSVTAVVGKGIRDLAERANKHIYAAFPSLQLPSVVRNKLQEGFTEADVKSAIEDAKAITDFAAQPALRKNQSKCSALLTETETAKRHSPDGNMLVKYVSRGLNLLEFQQTGGTYYLTPFVDGVHLAFNFDKSACENKSGAVECFEGEGRLSLQCFPNHSAIDKPLRKSLAEMVEAGHIPGDGIDTVFIGSNLPLKTSQLALRALKYVDEKSAFLVENYWGQPKLHEELNRYFFVVDGAAFPSMDSDLGSVVVLRPKNRIPPLVRQLAMPAA